MTPKLIISPEEPYTRREIMEEEQSELWKRATECVKKLSEVQKRVVELLPECRKQLPTQYADLQDKKALSVLLNHIHLRSLYAFSNSIYRLLDNQCKDLANCIAQRGERQAEEEYEALETTLDTLSKISFDSLIKDTSITGLENINKIKKEDLHGGEVFYVYSNGNWEFHDTLNTVRDIVNKGIVSEQLWSDAIKSQDPASSDIKELLDDNETLRIY
jgi:hypothetical protein